MPKKIAEGDPVRVSDREAVAADTKSALFYPHYRGLTGTLAKAYSDGTASVTVDPESLPKDARARHEAGSAAERQKWLDGLSDERCNKLSAAEKRLALRYTILVAMDDLAPGPARPDGAPDSDAAPARKSLGDLEAEEARHLDEVARRKP